MDQVVHRIPQATTVHLGTLLFAFSCFWGYIAVSQLLLIWYANLPEETFWFAERWAGGWRGVSLALMLLRFALPFLVLLSRAAKSNPRVLTVMAALDPHPALRAVVPKASPADMWLGDDFHHNGAFRLSYGFEYAYMVDGAKESQHFLEVEVEDDGPGLAQTANLFVPFFTTKPGGSGIGLALGRQIAEAHGGSLALANRQGTSGCLARIRLPKREGSHTVRPPGVPENLL